jgi:hypothetical protein
MTASNPTLNTYKYLHDLHQNTLKCTCSNMVVPYHTVASVSPTFHQVCFSDFVKDSWISSLLLVVEGGDPLDWRFSAGLQFRMLSSLCKLAQTTVNNAINNFVTQSLITSNLLTQDDFNDQSNATLNQLIQSTNIRYREFVDIMQLFMQVDQPFTGIKSAAYQNFNTQLMFAFKTSETSSQQLGYVRLFSQCKTKTFNFLSILSI